MKDIDEYIDGTINGWAVNVYLSSGQGSGWFMQASPYTDENDNPVPEEIFVLCHKITDSRIENRKQANSILKQVGFIPDME